MLPKLVYGRYEGIAHKESFREILQKIDLSPYYQKIEDTLLQVRLSLHK